MRNMVRVLFITLALNCAAHAAPQSQEPQTLAEQRQKPATGATRTEKDLLGEKDVPADTYYGVQTTRALENFRISGIPTVAHGQTAAQPQQANTSPAADTIDDKLVAGDNDDPEPARQLVSWNEFHGKREYSLPFSARQHTPEQRQKLFKTYRWISMDFDGPKDSNIRITPSNPGGVDMPPPNDMTRHLVRGPGWAVARGVGLDLVGAALMLASPTARAQGQAPAVPSTPSTPDSEIEEAIAVEDGPLPPKDQKLMHWSDYVGKDFTFHFGYNLMYDIIRFKQDAGSVAQWGVLNVLEPVGKWRDIRLLASGKFPKSKRLIEWKVGYMRDGLNDTWLWRETGIIVGVPEIWGALFIGRTKLGVSMIKQMSGAAIQGLERAEIEDMIIPIQNDGIRWMGYLPKQHLVWNLGYFNETLLDKPLYPFMDQQYAARVIWLPLLSPADGKVLHLGANLKYGNPKDGKTQLKARPEATTAPYFLDTGVFPAEHEKAIGPEVWYRDNSLLFGGAYYFVRTEASEGNHQFQGGDIWASWLMTGEVRKYITRGGIFDFVYPKSSFFKGGTGAFEATIHATYTNANSGPIQGGKFWRVTPTLAWYPSYEFRFTLGYGYGVLDRFGISGAKTQFFQARIQFML